MKYIKLFKESIQQSDKLLSEFNIKSKSIDKLNQKLIENGLQAYAGYITKVILGSTIDKNRLDFDDAHINLVINIFKDIKSYKIDIEKQFPISDLKNISYKTVGISTIRHYVNEYKDYLLVKKFLTKYVPSFLRKDFNSLPKEELVRFYFFKEKIKDLDDLHSLTYSSNEYIDNIKKLSYIKDIKEWLDFVYSMLLGTSNSSIKELKEHNIVIYYENDTYLIYKAIDFKSYLVINYSFWCTKIESLFNAHSRENMIIYLNKKNIKESYISYNHPTSKKTLFFNFVNTAVEYSEVKSKVGRGINNISIKF